MDCSILTEFHRIIKKLTEIAEVRLRCVNSPFYKHQQQQQKKIKTLREKTFFNSMPRDTVRDRIKSNSYVKVNG